MSVNNAEKNKPDVMVSNLPLLFSNGNPTSIQSMSVEDLQYFVPFLLKCILGCEPSGWAKHAKFKWWPAGVPWSSIILSKKHQTPLWRSKLQQLVRQCYEYNGCFYLLTFSAKLQTMIGSFKYTDNWDGTTSMFDSNSGKLLVTFRNENMNYDKGFRQQCSSNRPMLLPRLNSPSTPKKSVIAGPNPNIGMEAPSSAQMVEPLPVSDIFLCDYCGADFNSLTAIKAHEGKCMAEKALQSQSVQDNYVEMETNNPDQAKFMWYLSLSSRNQTTRPPNVTPAKALPVQKKSCTLSDKRFTTIPFSSNLGQSFFKSSKLLLANSEILVSRYERSCLARSAGSALPVGESINYSVRTLRPCPQKRKDSAWTHSYCFNKANRRERMLTIETGLNRRARLLLASCKGARVNLRRLRKGEIEMWTRPKPKIPQPLLQPWIQRSIANLPPDCTISLAPVASSGVLLSPKQGASPTVMVSRPESAKHFVKQKPRARSPPALIPLITSTWSLQGAKKSFPFLPQPPASVSIAKKLPFKLEPRPTVTISRSLPPTSISIGTDIIDLCSSEDDEPTEEEKATVGAMLAKPLFLPPGVTITKIERKIPAMNPHTSPNSSSNSTDHERNNNRPRSISVQCAEPASTLRSPPPILKFMGHHHRVQSKESRATDPFPAFISNSFHSIAPFKLGKLPVEKREQMKQSLLKIQQKEAKTLPSATEKSCVGELHNFPLTNNPPSALPSCEEEQHLGVGRMLFPDDRFFCRKRTKDMEKGSVNSELISPQEPFRKHPKLDDSTIVRERAGIRDDSPTIIEVDVAFHDRENRGDSPMSAFGSITPDSRNGKRSRELMSLLNDECKELKQMGLEDMPLFNQRVTRCRTKSLPMMANRR